MLSCNRLAIMAFFAAMPVRVQLNLGMACLLF